jgi:gas vesicle protein
MSRRNRWPETISLFALGVAVGAAVGILFAPKSGEELREDIAEGVQDGLDKASSTGKKWARAAQKTADHAREQVKDAVDIAERAFDAARRA